MAIPREFNTPEYNERLVRRAESILTGMGVDGLLRVGGSQEIRREVKKAAEDLVSLTRQRLLKSRTPPPKDAAAWNVFFYRALRNVALDYRKKRLREKNWPSLDAVVPMPQNRDIGSFACAATTIASAWSIASLSTCHRARRESCQ